MSGESTVAIWVALAAVFAVVVAVVVGALAWLISKSAPGAMLVGLGAFAAAMTLALRLLAALRPK